MCRSFSNGKNNPEVAGISFRDVIAADLQGTLKSKKDRADSSLWFRRCQTPVNIYEFMVSSFCSFYSVFFGFLPCFACIIFCPFAIFPFVKKAIRCIKSNVSRLNFYCMGGLHKKSLKMFGLQRDLD